MSAGARRRLQLAAAPAAVVYAALASRSWWLCDDAFISFRYAANWAAGLGPRYNPGAVPPVEGYSNFLWTALMALAEAIGATPLVVAPALSLVCGGVLLWRVFRHARRQTTLAAAAAAALLLAASPPYAVWATSGLETMAFALLLFGVWELAVEPPASRAWRRLAPVAAAGLVLIRSDGLLWAAGVLAVAAVERRLCRRSLAPLAAPVAGGALAAAGQTVFRLLYYGEWVPNATLAKTPFGIDLLLRGLRYDALLLLTLVVPVLALAALPAARARLGTARTAALTALAAAPFLFAAGVGGDFLPMGRFLLPALPFLALLAAPGLAAWLAPGRRRRVAAGWAAVAFVALVGALPLWGLHPVPQAWREPLQFRKASYPFVPEIGMWQLERDQVGVFSDVGLALRRATVPGDRVVLGIIGAAGYYSGRYLYDLYGLVTPRVARRPVAPGELVMAGHDRGVGPFFFLDERPAVLFASPVPAGPGLPDIVGGWVADLRRRVGDLYAPDLAPMPPDRDGSPRYLFLFRRIPPGADPAVAWERFGERLYAAAAPVENPGGSSR